jgi:molybdopterin converting factor small subunit
MDQSPSGSVPITVLFFSFAAERMGAKRLEETVPEGTTADEVFRRYAARLGAPRDRFLFAVNDEWAPADRRLSAGDVLAIIPPVAGG